MDEKVKLKKEFEQVKEQHKPQKKYLKNSVMAFIVGGGICTIAQIINNLFMLYGINSKEAGLITTIIMVFLGSLLTGIGVYDSIGKVAGAGSIVPITGFANSIVSCAMEFKAEGPVFGVGAKMFNIAGPVLVYGVLSSWIVGLIYYIYLLIAR